MSQFLQARARLGALAVVAVAAFGATASSALADDGQVFTQTNGAAGNAVLAFDRAADGHLVAAGTYPTGGLGTGAGLGSQGAVAADGARVYAVDAASGDVAALRVGRHGARVVDRQAAGVRPVSVTLHDSLAYVLDAAGAGQILGFRVHPDGSLKPISGSARPLSEGAAGAAQVSFSPDGRWLAVTEKGTSRIDTYSVRPNGRTEGPVVSASAGATPFGFAFDPAGHLIASEAGASTASSYAIAPDGTLGAISTSIPTLQGAACWVAVTPDGRHAYTGNGGGNVTGFAIAADGALTRLRADGLSGSSPRPNDVVVSPDGRDLYVINPAASVITSFAIAPDGSLTALATTTGVPAGLAGLAAS